MCNSAPPTDMSKKLKRPWSSVTVSKPEPWISTLALAIGFPSLEVTTPSSD